MVGVAGRSGGARGGGRPKGSRDKKSREVNALLAQERKVLIAEITALAQGFGIHALATLAEVMREKDAPHAARVSAAIAVLDRAYGKPKQAHEHRFDPSKLTDEELAYLISVEQRLAGLERAAGGAVSPIVIEGERADRPEPGSVEGEVQTP